MNKPWLIICLPVLMSLFACSSESNPETDEIGQVESYMLTINQQLTDKYNQEIAFFADLTRPSNKYRFYVLDLKEGKVIEKGLCLNGKTDNAGNVTYSNTPGSNCSSRGLAKVSYRYTGRFGKSYKLEGLEDTNSNMFKRAVVLHSWSGVPNFPVPYYPIESEGCPTVSPDFLETLSEYIDQSPKPILLYIQ